MRAIVRFDCRRSGLVIGGGSFFFDRQEQLAALSVRHARMRGNSTRKKR
jgi:hypothetical protein